MRRGYQFRCAMPVWGIDIFERSRTFFVLSSPTNWRRNADEPHKGVSGKVTSRSASARLDDGVFIDALQRLGSGAVCPLASVLCDSLAFFAVKFSFTAKLAKNCRQERKAKPRTK